MVKNSHGFIPKRYYPKPSYYKERESNWSAGFISSDKNRVFEIRMFANFTDDYKTGKYLHLHKKVKN